MRWLREWISTALFESIRAQDFKRDEEQGPGARIINHQSTATGQRVTIRLAPDSSMDPDLLQLMNRSNVEMTDISTKDSSTYIKIEMD